MTEPQVQHLATTCRTPALRAMHSRSEHSIQNDKPGVDVEESREAFTAVDPPHLGAAVDNSGGPQDFLVMSPQLLCAESHSWHLDVMHGCGSETISALPPKSDGKHPAGLVTRRTLPLHPGHAGRGGRDRPARPRHYSQRRPDGEAARSHACLRCATLGPPAIA